MGSLERPGEGDEDHLDERRWVVGEAEVPLLVARPSTDLSLRPRLRMVSIMPGMEARAPERTETRREVAASPNFAQVSFDVARPSRTSF